MKTTAPYNSSSISSNLGIGCRYFTVILFIARQSAHMRQVPLFLIFHRYIVYSSAVRAHAPSAIVLWHQQNRNSTWTWALTHPPVAKEFTHLFLHLLGLLWVTPAGWPVWESGSRDEVNLMLYPLRGGRPRGMFSENTSSYSCKISLKELGN